MKTSRVKPVKKPGLGPTGGPGAGGNSSNASGANVMRPHSGTGGGSLASKLFCWGSSGAADAGGGQPGYGTVAFGGPFFVAFEQFGWSERVRYPGGKGVCKALARAWLSALANTNGLDATKGTQEDLRDGLNGVKPSQVAALAKEMDDQEALFRTIHFPHVDGRGAPIQDWVNRPGDAQENLETALAVHMKEQAEWGERQGLELVDARVFKGDGALGLPLGTNDFSRFLEIGIDLQSMADAAGEPVFAYLGAQSEHGGHAFGVVVFPGSLGGGAIYFDPNAGMTGLDDGLALGDELREAARTSGGALRAYSDYLAVYVFSLP